METREWKDGLLSSTMRDMANAPDASPKWIILDGDLDPNWIENSKQHAACGTIAVRTYALLARSEFCDGRQPAADPGLE